jgi:hypothetical protein
VEELSVSGTEAEVGAGAVTGAIAVESSALDLMVNGGTGAGLGEGPVSLNQLVATTSAPVEWV